MNIEKIKLLGNRVLLQQLPVKPKGLIIRVGKDTGESAEYIVRAVGDGPKIPEGVKVGVKVSVTNMGFHAIQDEDAEGKRREFRVYSTEDIVAILPDDDVIVLPQ